LFAAAAATAAAAGGVGHAAGVLESLVRHLPLEETINQHLPQQV